MTFQSSLYNVVELLIAKVTMLNNQPCRRLLGEQGRAALKMQTPRHIKTLH